MRTLLLLLLLSLGVLGQTTFYLDTSAATAGSGSLNSPYNDMSDAIAAISGGDTLLVKTGLTVTEPILDPPNGTQGNPTVLGKYGSGANPILTVTSGTGRGIELLDDVTHIHISDFTVTSCTNEGVYLEGYMENVVFRGIVSGANGKEGFEHGSGLTGAVTEDRYASGSPKFINCVASGNSGDGFSNDGSSRGILIGCTSQNHVTGEGITTHDRSSWVCWNSTFTANTDNTALTNGYFAQGGYDNRNLFFDCVFSDPDAAAVRNVSVSGDTNSVGASTFFYRCEFENDSFAIDNVKVESQCNGVDVLFDGCVFRGSSQDMVDIDGTCNVKFLNSSFLFIDPGASDRHGIRGPSSGAVDVEIYNCFFYAETAAGTKGSRMIRMGGSTGTVVIKNSVFGCPDHATTSRNVYVWYESASPVVITAENNFFHDPGTNDLLFYNDTAVSVVSYATFKSDNSAQTIGWGPGDAQSVVEVWKGGTQDLDMDDGLATDAVTRRGTLIWGAGEDLSATFGTAVDGGYRAGATWNVGINSTATGHTDGGVYTRSGRTVLSNMPFVQGALETDVPLTTGFIGSATRGATVGGGFLSVDGQCSVIIHYSLLEFDMIAWSADFPAEGGSMPIVPDRGANAGVLGEDLYVSVIVPTGETRVVSMTMWPLSVRAEDLPAKK